MIPGTHTGGTDSGQVRTGNRTTEAPRVGGMGQPPDIAVAACGMGCAFPVVP
jgi:hypothetical protein